MFTIVLTMAAALSASVASAQASGLVAAYSFDEGAGPTVTDRSGNGNNGTLVSGTAWSTTAKFGAAASFDGTNDRIDVADSNTLDLTAGMTLEAWVRPTANSSYRTIVLKEVPGELAYSLYAADSDHGARSSGWIRVANVSRFADGTSNLPLNVYSHIAVTFNGAALVFYVNGVQTRSTAVAGNIQTTSLPLRIGGNTIWGEFFQGQIDEVRVYNRALLQSEIQADMVTPISGAPDTAAPTVSLTAPSNGATLSGTATLSANAADNVGVAGVQFRVDGANVGAEDATSPFSIQWNTSGAGNGSHQITAVARDSVGNTTTSAAVTVTVTSGDVQAPTVSLTAPANGATVSGTTPVSANAADNVGVVGVQFKVDGTNLGAEDTTSPYSVQWNTTTAAPGSHQLTAVARDLAGNSATSAPAVVTVNNADGTAPVVSLTSPANGATVSAAATVSADASDNVGIVGVQFRLDGNSLGAEDLTAPYSISWTTTGTNNGSHQLTATARDAAGNTTTSAARTVTVSNSSGDSQAPSVSLTAPANGATVSGSLSVTANASDNVGVVGVQFKVDGVNFGTEDTSATYSRTWDSLSVSNGTHSLTAVARDAAGNTRTSAARTVTVSNSSGDSQAPTVSLTAPANGASVSGSLSVTASATDNVGVVGVQFRVDGVNFGTEDTSATYSRTWDSLSVSNGTHSLTAIARDAAGNTTTSAARTVTVSNSSGDSQAPTVSLTAPASGATVSGSISVTASASDNVGVVGVQFRLDGNSLGAEDLTAPYSVSWTTTGTSNGTHQLTATARDAGGRTATATRSVTVNNTGGGGTSLTINGNQRSQTIDGFGISANSASWDGGELRPAIDKLADDGGSTIWRVIIDQADWEATNDDGNPSTFNWTYYNTIYSSPKFEELWATLAYLNQKGVTSLLMLNFMGRGPAWMGGPDLPTAMEEEWVETVASVAYYARNNRHIQFGIFAPNNESDWDGYEGIRMDRTQHARVMRKLAQKLDAIGLGDLRLLGPDTANIYVGVDNYTQSLMAEPAVMAKLDHFAFHNYDGDSGMADTRIKNSAYPGKNFWISEVSNVSAALEHMHQGPTAILVWDGYDSVYNHAILAGRGTTPPNDAGNGPALLAYSTATHLYTARKAFYEFAQLFKFVPAGSVRVAASESNGNVTIYAFHHQVTGRVTLVGRNAGSSNVTFAGRLSNLPVVPSFESYRTTSSENMQRGADVPVTDGAFSYVASGNSVFTLTYSGPADTIPPTVSVTAPLAGATVSGTITVSSATAVDNVGIHGVQFRLDGALLGVEDTSAPYGVQWNSADVANGAHSLIAVARDWRGNVTTSEPIVVTVSN
ncbi:MAG TPA: Ig-like domain-containing protein [Steroidobacteraceae bacterium]|nr:Ig-like domain-containing protein [Steroidobacteraceae bacterium]